MSGFFTSRHMPCAECGASLQARERDSHICEPERRLEFRLFLLREEISTFDDGLSRYLSSAHGRFAQWIAERERLRDPRQR